MRTTHWKVHLLPLLLLSLYSVSVCLALSCPYDNLFDENVLTTIATAAKQQTGQNWEPLRIQTSAKDIEGPPRYCAKNNDESVYEVSTQTADADCRVFFGTLPAGKTTSAMSILQKAVKLHTDRLLVQRAAGPLLIPRFSSHPVCKFFNVPAEHLTTGVANADMVLYVAYNQQLGRDSSSFSLGLTCAKSAEGRPIVGGLIFGSDDLDISRHSVRLAAHHIAHALGFSYSEMKSRNMIVNENVREKSISVAVVKSDKTKKMTQEHYGCPAAKGMELEDGEDNNEKLSHWERRNAKDELMAKPVGGPGVSFMGFYSSLTMAAFEDMGFYKANFTMAEHMEYGYKAGCGFLNGKCMDKGVTEWTKMFCSVPKSSAFAEVCTSDRMGFGHCFIKEDYNTSLLAHFQYFTSDKKGGEAQFLTDYCPVIEQHRYFGCTNTEQQGSVHGGLYGKNSMCLDGSELQVKTSTDATVSVPAVCAEISCEGGSLKVKYLGDKTNKWHDCPEGQSLTPSLTSTAFVSGKIKCPKYEEVCTVAPDGSSLVPKVIIQPATTAPQDPKASQKPTGQPNDPNSSGKSKDGSPVPFGLIPSVAFLVLSFAGYLIA